MNFFKVSPIFLLLTSFSISALETENLCLTNRAELGKAKSDLSVILLPDETVDMRRSIGCLEVNFRAYRKDLIHSFMRRRYRYRVADSISNNEVRLEHANISPQVAPMCRLELEQQGGGSSNQQQVQVGRQTKLKSNTHNSQETIKSEIVLTSGLPGTLSIDGETLIVNCFVRGNGRYQISLNLGNKLITSVELMKGKSLDIGQVVRDYNDGDQGVKDTNLYKEKTKGKFLTKYFLKIK